MLTEKRLNFRIFILLSNRSSLTYHEIVTIWQAFDNQFIHYLRNNGPVATLKLYKACSLFLRNYLLELECTPIPFVKVDKSGIPKPLWPLRRLLHFESTRRIAFTFTRITDRIILPAQLNEEMITSPLVRGPGYRKYSKLFKVWSKFFIQYHKDKLTLVLRGEFRLRSPLGSGPNGPAVATSATDLIALRRSPKLLETIKTMNKLCGQEWLNSVMEFNVPDCNLPKKEVLHSRLGILQEAGGKSRTFSVFDYWSQNSLKPLHDSLSRILRSFPNDGTHDQNASWERAIARSKGHGTFCYDLSSASDRIPAFQQARIIGLMGKSQLLGSVWHSIMCDREFRTPDGHNIKWKVGQPLGALSSFPAFALWHHFILQFCAWLDREERGFTSKFHWFDQYEITGDDLVIWNKRVAHQYIKVMAAFGISINMSKSVISNDSTPKIEYLKRHSLDGVEISTIKHNILFKGNYAYALDFIDLMYKRRYLTSNDSFDKIDSLFPKGVKYLPFRVMAWYRFHDGPAYSFAITGNHPLEVVRSTLTEKVREERIQALHRKAETMSMILDGKSVVELMKSFRVPYRKHSIETEDGDFLQSHPLVWALNQTGNDLANAFDVLWGSEDPLEVEYLPLISRDSYFHRNMDQNVNLSKIFAKVTKELLQHDTESIIK